MSLDIITFPIKQPHMFNELITTTNHYISSSMTRQTSTRSHGCNNTQFIYICSCILGINVDFSGKKTREIDDLMNYYANKINIIYETIKNNFRTLRNKNAIFNNDVDDEIITTIDSTNDQQITSSTFYNYGYWDIIPLCMFHNNFEDSTDQLKYIAHYFTLIINNIDNSCYINSSYGSDEICVLSATKEIKMETLNRIITKINHDNFDTECENFVREYFLPGVDIKLYEYELLTLRRSYIGLINNYISIINTIIRENPQLKEENLTKKRRRIIGGKNTRQIKKYKIKNNKTKRV